MQLVLYGMPFGCMEIDDEQTTLSRMWACKEVLGSVAADMGPATKVSTLRGSRAYNWWTGLEVCALQQDLEEGNGRYSFVESQGNDHHRLRLYKPIHHAAMS
eukprot:COSAG02_NODE_163_length_32424_cov_21.759010_25_plen_102_part_00